MTDPELEVLLADAIHKQQQAAMEHAMLYNEPALSQRNLDEIAARVCLRAIADLIERLQAPAVDVVELSNALDEYLAENDEDQWCQRVKYGHCELRKCLVAKGEKVQPPIDFEKASCPRWRIEQSRAALSASQPTTAQAEREATEMYYPEGAQ